MLEPKEILTSWKQHCLGCGLVFSVHIGPSCQSPSSSASVHSNLLLLLFVSVVTVEIIVGAEGFPAIAENI